jgi:predicted phage-related endonuclease
MANLEYKIRQYREFKRLADEAQAAADGIADELKEAMTALGQDKMTVGEYKLSYTDCTRKDLDRGRLENDLGDLSEYMKVTTYKRFSVA